MYQYYPFVKNVKRTLQSSLKNYSINEEAILNILDGRPSGELKRLVPNQQLKKAGAYFTGNELKKKIFSEAFISTINKDSIIVDPACGGGDLLLSCIPYLPFDLDLEKTLIQWQSNLFGLDLYKEFIEITKLRLILQALKFGAKPNKTDLSFYEDYFNGISLGSIFTNCELLKNASHILINPPYYLMQAPEICKWGKGKVNAAAVFLEKCINDTSEGTRIIAILPDVLRSGTRYKKWRTLIESKCEISRVELYGQFDKWTDIDVFILELIVKDGSKKISYWGKRKRKTEQTVGERFTLSIGSVVEYRDPFEGPKVKYIVPRDLLPWDTVYKIDKYRFYNGKTYQCPFVTVKRTSRKGDKYRAIATIINERKKVAVENHLIVLEPKDGNLSTCQELIEVLKDRKTRKWLDKMICCRHLTKESLANLPWWKDS